MTLGFVPALGATNPFETIEYTLSGVQEDVNLYNLLVPSLWNGTDKVRIEVTIQEGTVIGTQSTANYAMIVSGFTNAQAVIITNNGLIVGQGGDGGSRSNVITGSYNGSSGANGGPALNLQSTCTLINNGTIAGGGGGGGAGGGLYVQVKNSEETSTQDAYGYAGQGGQGKGYSNQSGPSAGASGDYVIQGSSSIPPYIEAYAGDGGTGGDYGAVGNSGDNAVIVNTVGTITQNNLGVGVGGGSAGGAIVGVSNATLTNNGTISGAQSG